MAAPSPAFLSTVDLHTHSTASDGSLAPAAVVQAAAEVGVQMLALTDHDTVRGLDEAAAAARRCGITLVPGVELSVRWKERSLHLVGLDIDPAAPALVAGLAELQRIREIRAAGIAQRLERIGVHDALARTQALAHGNQPTRTHFARLLVADGICRDLERAFSRYLGAGKPAYVGAAWPELDQAVDWIRRAGGQAVIAHPLRYRFGSQLRGRLYQAFREMGGAGIEVCCGTSDADDVRRSANEAAEQGLKGSVGSDFHGPEQPWVRLGRVAPLPATVDAVWASSSA